MPNIFEKYETDKDSEGINDGVAAMNQATLRANGYFSKKNEIKLHLIW